MEAMDLGVRAGAALVAVVAVAIVGWVTVVGYAPGDASGATRMSSTRQTGLISLGLAVAALLPLGVFRWILLIAAGVLLLLSLGFLTGILGR